ncbi:DUF6158 family protein [Actinoplanes sp. G11-F43]|uniref:DUF6158 family protein n=1 Tax=Actinoplanes sp. G11-F43 TaxID=3424130 RepID=UPI003D3448C6
MVRMHGENGGAVAFDTGVDPAGLSDEDLFRELASLYRTRLDTLRHGPDPALDNHFKRTAELETEYMARHPGREVDPGRLSREL